jgi:hypothetical protein
MLATLLKASQTSGSFNIAYVGGTTGTTTGGTDNWTVSLTSLSGGLATSPSIGDLVVVYYGIGATSDSLSPTVASTGYELIATRGANDSNDANLGVSYKVLSTAETEVVLVGTGSTARGGAVAVYVWRGVAGQYSNSFPIVTASGENSVLCDPPAITPANQGSVILAGGVGAHDRGVATFSSSDLTSFISAGANSTVDATIGLGYVDWTSGAFNPAAFTFSAATSTAFSWAAATMALSPDKGPTTQIGPFPISSAYRRTGTTTVVNVTKPLGTREGDLMIVVAASNTSSATPSTWTTSGWTELVDLGSPPSLLVAYKIATAGEASSYAFTNAVSAALTASIVTYRNAAYDNAGSILTNSDPLVIPSVFVGVDYSRVIAAVARGEGGNIIKPSTMQEVFFNDEAVPAIMVAQDAKLAIYGESGSRTFDPLNNDKNAGVLVSIKPAVSYTPYANYIRRESLNPNQANTSGTITFPEGAVPGNVLLLLVQAVASTASTIAPTITTPAGWSVVDTNTFTDAGSGFTVTLYKRVVDGSEGTTVSLVFSVSSIFIAGLVSCGGVDENIVYSRNYQSSTSTATGTSITATTNGLLLYMSTTANTADTGSRSFGAVSGMTEQLDVGSTNRIDPRIGFSSQEGLTAGSTGNKSSTLNGSVTSATTYLICVPAK